MKLFWQKNLNLIIAAVLFTFFLFLPSVIISTCPKGIINDPFPGRCGLYSDKDQNQICDLSQVTAAVTPSKIFNFSFIWQTHILLIFLAMAVVFTIKTKSSYRYPLLAVSFLFALFTFKNLCPIVFLQFLLILKDQVVLNFFPFLIFVLTIISTLIFGKIFCGWICPIGAIQELIFRLLRWLRVHPAPEHRCGVKIPDLTKKVPPILKFLPLLILTLIGFWVVRSGKTIFCQLDPFGYLFACPAFGGGCSASHILLGALLVFFLISLLIFRPFCLFLCPLGAIFSALASVSVWQIKKDKKRCNRCQLCLQQCPTGAIDQKLRIDQKQCFRCQECLLVCSKKALSYKS